MTPPPVVERIVALSLEHPALGCRRLSAVLRPEGTRVSSPTIQTILAKHGMAARCDRRLKLEERVASDPIEPSAD